MQNRRFPGINIRSKNELAKRLAGRTLTVQQALDLINDVLANFDKYWRDNAAMSKPDANKWVRDASHTNLGKLLKLINQKLLAPHDEMLPDFLFGGITGKNHKAAVQHLLGTKRGRVLLKLDISRFYERIELQRVEQFFALKAGCSREAARLLARLCCVPYGPKGQPEKRLTVARGFATSSRLAVWCNLDAFMRLERLVHKELRGSDARVAIYVDDIGITASRVNKEAMMELYPKIEHILTNDPKQPLPLNMKKTKIIFHDGETYDIVGNYQGKWCFEILGLQMGRNRLAPGTKTRWKTATVIDKLKHAGKNRAVLKRSKRALTRYREYISN
jgi:hypothetical protein